MMNQPKDATFKCPSCGEMLSVESKGSSDSETMGKKPNAGTMPMGQLKSKIQPTTNPPGIQSPNLNSY